MTDTAPAQPLTHADRRRELYGEPVCSDDSAYDFESRVQRELDLAAALLRGVRELAT